MFLGGLPAATGKSEEAEEPCRKNSHSWYQRYASGAGSAHPFAGIPAWAKPTSRTRRCGVGDTDVKLREALVERVSICCEGGLGVVGSTSGQRLLKTRANQSQMTVVSMCRFSENLTRYELKLRRCRQLGWPTKQSRAKSVSNPTQWGGKDVGDSHVWSTDTHRSGSSCIAPDSTMRRTLMTLPKSGGWRMSNVRRRDLQNCLSNP